jgi:hypothetical protein
MVISTLVQKSETKFTPSERAKKLFQTIYREQNKPAVETDEPKIRVSEVVSKMAFYYEKIRNTVDDKEEGLHLKNAIERIMRRQITIEMNKDGASIATNLLHELIRAGYLPNNKIPEAKIGEVSQIIDRYIKLRRIAMLAVEGGLEFQEKMEISRWVVSLAACELEERLRRKKVDQVIITNMYEVLSQNIELPDDSPYHRDREIQIYISIYRSYFKADQDMISFVLFKYYISDWLEAPEAKIEQVGKNIIALIDAIKHQVEHPIAPQINKIVNRYHVYNSILSEVIAQDPVKIYDSFSKDPKAFGRDIKAVCSKRYKNAKTKLWRAGIRSVIYLLITKSVLVLILEIPVATLLGEAIEPSSLLINVSFPPLLLFMIIMFSSLPSDRNTARIVEGVEELTFVEKARKETFLLRPPAKRSNNKNYFFNFFYAITFLLTFGAVVWGLNKIHFNFVSITIFLFFLALISFFSIRVRKNIKELLVVEPRENIFIFLADFFYVPIIAVGKWLSERFSRLNVFVLILDFIIEAPFKLVVQITEEWTKYVRERKDDISQ